MKKNFFSLFLFFFSFFYSQYYIIGDSQSFFIAKNCKAKIYPSLAKKGIGLRELQKMVETTKKDNDIKVIFITIGVNDSYKDYGIRKLIQILYEKFPNAYLFAIQGSYHWGNVQISRELAIRYIHYYKTFESCGVYVLEQNIGSGDPHINKNEYSKIGENINYILQSFENEK